ncbi:MAG: phosphatidate cytidylyltransferase [Verrucomicrobiales bacterium]|nr:phosphatidate cytidylyltransferase [Verrucomicrobiales bacterium]
MSSAPTVPPSNPKPLTKGQTFVRRLASTLVLWTIVLTAIFSTHPVVANYVFLLLVTGLAAAGLWEFYGLVEQRGLVCFRGWGLCAGVALMASTHYYVTHARGFQLGPGKPNDFETGVLVLFVLGLCLRQLFDSRNPNGIVAIATTLLGLMYVPWLLNFIQKINYLDGVDGRFYVLYLLIVTKFSDVGAYCVGSLIGRHKMIPRISPGKTWEGFVGAVVVSTGASFLMAHFAGGRLKEMNPGHALAIGLILSLGAVVGDLIESAFKREAGAKDSGRLFPGIGGILDLIDSPLFNAPLLYLYLRHVLTH